MKAFAEKVIQIEEKSIDNINEYYFKQAIALAIIFKSLEKDISKSSWFPEGSGYRANIVTYTIAKLFYCINKQCDKSKLDFNQIWIKQKVYPELESVLNDIAKNTYDFLNRKDRLMMNISEWCKKEECWKYYKEVPYILPKYFIDTLQSVGEAEDLERNAKKDQRLTNQINAEIEVVNYGGAYWERLMYKAKEFGILNVIEETDLRIAARMETTGRTPNSVQAKRLLQFRKKCSEEGIDVDNI